MSDQQRGRLQTQNNPRILSRSPIVVLRAPSNGFINVQMSYKKKIGNIANDIIDRPNSIKEPRNCDKDVPWTQSKIVHPSRFDFSEFRLEDQRLLQNERSRRNTVQTSAAQQVDANARTYSNESTGSDEAQEKQLGIQTDEESQANQIGISQQSVPVDGPSYSYKGRFTSTKKQFQQLTCQTNLRPDTQSNRNSVQVSPNQSVDEPPIQFQEVSPSRFENNRHQMMLDYISDSNFIFQSQFKGLTQKPATPIRESCPEKKFRFGSLGKDEASKPSQLDFIITRPVDPKTQKRAFQNRQIQRPQIAIPSLKCDSSQEHNKLKFNLSAENTPILAFESQIDQIEPQNIRESLSCDKFTSQNLLQLSTERPRKSQERNNQNRPVEVQPSFHLLQIDQNQRKIDNIQKLIEQSKSRRGTKQIDPQEVPQVKSQVKERPIPVERPQDNSLKQITQGKYDDRGRRFSIDDPYLNSRLHSRRCATLEKAPAINSGSQSTSRLTRFKKLKFLGKGKFSDVYSVIDSKTGFICALKTMQKSIINSKQLNQLILSEIKIQSYLRHPNIVRTYGIIDDYKQIGIILEHCEMSLLQYFESRKLSEEEIMYVAYQILKGLSYIHSQGVIHRDLKPENILMVNKYVKIADFGISIHATSSRQYCGTITYMAPEVREQKQYDNKADCYSVGMIIKEMAEHSQGKLNRRTYLFRLIEELTLNNPKQRLTADLAIRMYLSQFEKIKVDNFDFKILSD